MLGEGAALASEENRMEFHVTLTGPSPDLRAVNDAICGVDPAAVVDIDAASQTLRVAASVTAAELVSLIGQAGYPIAQHQVAQLPSVCCGGCSG